MVEKIGKIRNPLTIIAIFAGIAEVSGTIILPFLSSEHQFMFLIFLMGFPTLLVILFFLTLNLNSKVLYAPSDFSNEDNYLKVLKYNKIDDGLNETVIDINGQHIASKMIPISDLDLNKNEHNKKNDYKYSIVNFTDSKTFIEKMKKQGYNFKLYYGLFNCEYDVKDFETHKSIWLGKYIPFDIIKEIIIELKKFYKHLCYIHISGDLSEFSPEYINNEIFVGGSTETAINYNIGIFSDEDFTLIENATTKNEIFSIIRNKYQNNEPNKQ